MSTRNKVALILALAWFVLCMMELYLNVPAMPRHVRAICLIVGILLMVGVGFLHNSKD